MDVGTHATRVPAEPPSGFKHVSLEVEEAGDDVGWQESKSLREGNLTPPVCINRVPILLSTASHGGVSLCSAFVPSSAVKPYTGSGTAAKRSKNAKLQHALEEADAQLARQGGKAVHVGRGKRGATTTTAVKPAGDGSAVLPVVEADIPPATAAAEGDAFHGV